MDNNRSEKPLGVAIVICERVITEARSNNKTLISTFNHITAKAFPCRHPQMAVYVALTSGQGEKRIDLVLRRDQETPVIKMGGKVRFLNPNQVIELIFDLRSLVFPRPGVYAFEVLADEEIVLESRFQVTQKS